MFNEEQRKLINDALHFYYLNQSMSGEDWEEWDKIRDSIHFAFKPKP